MTSKKPRPDTGTGRASDLDACQMVAADGRSGNDLRLINYADVSRLKAAFPSLDVCGVRAVLARRNLNSRGAIANRDRLSFGTHVFAPFSD